MWKTRKELEGEDLGGVGEVKRERENNVITF